MSLISYLVCNNEPVYEVRWQRLCEKMADGSIDCRYAFDSHVAISGPLNLRGELGTAYDSDRRAFKRHDKDGSLIYVPLPAGMERPLANALEYSFGPTGD